MLNSGPSNVSYKFFEKVIYILFTGLNETLGLNSFEELDCIRKLPFNYSRIMKN
jgi:hypothetical protein